MTVTILCSEGKLPTAEKIEEPSSLVREEAELNALVEKIFLITLDPGKLFCHLEMGILT